MPRPAHLERYAAAIAGANNNRGVRTLLSRTHPLPVGALDEAALVHAHMKGDPASDIRRAESPLSVFDSIALQ